MLAATTQWHRTWSPRAALLALGLSVASAACALTATYVPATQLDLTEFLPPPPAAGSRAQQEDLKAVLAAQATRTPASVAAAQADQKASVFRFADVLGPSFAPEKLPLTDQLFRAVGRDSAQVGARAKAVWERPRPFRVSPDVQPVLSVHSDGSYPSGHSMFGCVSAVLLGTIVPERRSEILARGELYGQHRLIGGVHYPSDVAAGCDAGRVMAAVLLQSPDFRSDLAAARAETRQVLGLP